MDLHPGYYKNLIEYCKNMPCPMGHQIELDLKRTFPKDPFFQEEENIKKLKNILLAFSRRNSSIGYCQGFNLIVGKILKVCENEVNIKL